MRCLAIAASCLFATVLHAQQDPGVTNPLALVPADCQLVLRVNGPAALGKQLGRTGLGKVFGGATMAPAFELMQKKLDEQVKTDPAHFGDVPQLLSVLLEYTGVMVLAVRLDLSDLGSAMQELRAPAFAAAIVCGGDGHTDLAALATTLTGKLRDAGLGEAKEVMIAGEPLALLELPFGQLSQPMLRDGNLVLLFGSDLEKTAESFFTVAAGKGYVLADELQQGSMAAVIELGPVIDEGLAQMVKLEHIGVPELAKLLPPMELDALRRITWRVYPDGQYVGQDTAVEFRGPLRGLWPVFLLPKKNVPSVLQYLPTTATTFATSSFDPVAFHQLYARIYDSFGEAVPMPRAAFEQRFTTMTKLRLKEDVLDALTGEMLRIDDLTAVDDITAEEEEEEGAAARDRLDTKYGDACFVLGLHDGRTFGANLEKLIRARGLHAARKSEDYGDTRIHRLVVLGSYVVEYAVTDQALVVGLGGRPGTLRNLRATLDAIANRAAGKPALPLPDAVQARIADLPAGWCDLDVASMADVVEGMLGYATQIEALADEALAQEDEEVRDLLSVWLPLGEVLKRLRPALQANKAEHTVSVTYKTADRVLLRSRW